MTTVLGSDRLAAVNEAAGRRRDGAARWISSLALNFRSNSGFLHLLVAGCHQPVGTVKEGGEVVEVVVGGRFLLQYQYLYVPTSYMYLPSNLPCNQSWLRASLTSVPLQVSHLSPSTHLLHT